MPGREAIRILDEVRTLVQHHSNPHLEAWKGSGRPIVGRFCSYVPPEVILAAGALPVRLRGVGSTDSSLGDAYLSGRLCTYVRHVISLALEGEYDFLDGQVSLNTCDHVRRAADVFTNKAGIGFNGFLSVPRATREDLLPWYLGELRTLLDDLCAHFGVDAGDDELRAAIRSMNRVKSRLTSLERLRLLDPPHLSGAEALALQIAASSLPPPVFVDLADQLLDALDRRPGLPSPRGRLVITGGELDEPEFVEVIESLGAIVVADQLCFGSRGLPRLIDEGAPDPLEAIARATFFRTSCARMIGDFPARYDALCRTVTEARADGVIFARLMFCDPWGADQHNLAHRGLSDAPFPVLFLTREYGIVPTGQMRTRVQAFLERIEIARAREGRT